MTRRTTSYDGAYLGRGYPLGGIEEETIPSLSPSAVYRLPSTRSGFTLLELLLVLALIAAISAMVWPLLAGPLATQRLKRAAEQVRTQLIKARTQAINTGETFGVTYQPGKNLLRIGTYTNNQALLES